MSLKETLGLIKKETQKITGDAEMLPYADLIARRVLIARLGDSDNNRWWNMAILSQFGKQHLADFFPKTIQSKRIPLAFAACAKAESRIISNKKYVSLFNLGFAIEREITRLLSKNPLIEANIENILSIIENVRCVLQAPGWMQQFGYGALANVNGLANTSNISSLNLGALDKQLSKECWAEIQDQLFAGYGNSCLGRLVVPYYEVRFPE